ncbi:MAG: hypothetical protein FJ225_12935 [Lentisphaerae bacterium]|nr:hypothetical protein [Lentisphaerota bacterium]
MKAIAKRTLCAVGALALAADLGAAAGENADRPFSGPEPVRVLKTDTPVTIDGVLDEPCWQGAEAIRVEYAYGKQGVKSDALPAVIRYAWDNEYLYVGYETFDADLIAAGSGEKQGPQRRLREGCRIEGSNDVFEVFVSFSDPNFFWELHHNALNNFSDVWVTVAPSNSPFARSSMTSLGIYWAHNECLKEGESDRATLETAVALKPNKDGKPSTVNGGDGVDTGYLGEMRIPWKSLGAPNEWVRKPDGIHGRTIVLFAAVQNPDVEPRYHHTSPGQKITGFFHQVAAGWPTYPLVDPAKDAAEQK